MTHVKGDQRAKTGGKKSKLEVVELKYKKILEPIEMSLTPLKNLAPPMSLNEIVLIEGLGVETGSKDQVQSNSYHMNSKFGNMLLMFLIIMVVFWVLLFTFNPKIAQSRYITTDGNGNTKTLPDAGRCFIGSLILSALITLVLWFSSASK